MAGPAGSVDRLATAMASALATPVAVLEQMGAAGARRVAERHDASIEANRLAQPHDGFVTTASLVAAFHGQFVSTSVGERDWHHQESLRIKTRRIMN